MRFIRSTLIVLSILVGIAIAANGMGLMSEHLLRYQQRAGLEITPTSHR